MPGPIVDVTTTLLRYCPFAAACQFDGQRDKFRYIEKLKGDDFWAAIDKKGSEASDNGRY